MRDRKYVSFSEVCTVKPPKKEAKERLKESDSVSFIPMKDLGVCRKDILGSQSKTLDKVYSGYTYFADNDVLLAKITPCFENGKLGIAKKLVNGIGFGSSEYIVLRANKSLYPKYLFYYLSQESIRVAGRKVMSGAVGHKRVPNDFIETRKIFFPPLPEQKRIVEMLDDAFLAIDKAIENTEKNLKNARDLFDSYLNKVFSDKGEGWKERKLKELCKTFHQGLNTAGEKIKFYESGFPIIQARNINAGLIEYENKIKYMCEDDWIEYKNKYRPQLGDVFFTNIGTIGKTAVVTSDIDYLIL
jgi:type I restriction enzyme S subunit